MFPVSFFLGFNNLPAYIYKKERENLKVLYLDCLKYDVKFTDKNNLFLSITHNDLMLRIRMIKKILERNKKSIKPLNFNKERFLKATSDVNHQRFLTIFDFEETPSVFSP